MSSSVKYTIGAFVFETDLTLEVEAADTREKKAALFANAIWSMVAGYHQAHNWSREQGLQAYFDVVPQQTQVINLAGLPNGNGNNEEKHPEQIVIPVMKMSKGSDKGNDVFKVYGGNFTKYGVTAYADSCVDGIGLFAKGYGQHTPDKPMQAVIQMRNKDPYRVLEIKYVG